MKITQVLDAIKFITLDRNFLTIVLLSIVIWLIESLIFYWIIISFDLTIYPYFTALASMIFVAFGILLPSIPAYVGIFQGMVILAMSTFGYTNEQSLAVGTTVHFFQFLPITLTGLLIYFTKVKKLIAA